MNSSIVIDGIGWEEKGHQIKGERTARKRGGGRPIIELYNDG
jgi:hypothetical protein